MERFEVVFKTGATIFGGIVGLIADELKTKYPIAKIM
jgi:hypothetical protein